MATIAPWLKPADVTEAASRGASAGAALRGLRQRANEALLAHSARMAGIAASSQSAAARTQLAREQMEKEAALKESAGQRAYDLAGQELRQKSAESAGKLGLERQKLAESGRQADLKSNQSPFSYQVAGKGKVLKIDKRTGEHEVLDFPELRETGSDRLAAILSGQDQSMEQVQAPSSGNAQEQPAQAMRQPRNMTYMGPETDGVGLRTSGTFFAGQPPSLMTGPNPRRYVEEPAAQAQVTNAPPVSDVLRRFQQWKQSQK